MRRRQLRTLAGMLVVLVVVGMVMAMSTTRQHRDASPPPGSAAAAAPAAAAAAATAGRGRGLGRGSQVDAAAKGGTLSTLQHGGRRPVAPSNKKWAEGIAAAPAAAAATATAATAGRHTDAPPCDALPCPALQTFPENWVALFSGSFARGDIELLLLTKLMFWNARIYSKLLVVWDSGEEQGDALKKLFSGFSDVLFVDSAQLAATNHMMAELELEDDLGGREGHSYAKQLMMKMYMDVFVSMAVSAYKLPTLPAVVSIIDADVFWHTLPTPESVYLFGGEEEQQRGRSRILVHGRMAGQQRYTAQLRALDGRSQAVLGRSVPYLLDSMVAFPIAFNLSTFELARQTVVAGHPEIRRFEQIFEDKHGVFSEFGVMHSVAVHYQHEQYGFMINPWLQPKHHHARSQQQARPVPVDGVSGVGLDETAIEILAGAASLATSAEGETVARGIRAVFPESRPTIRTTIHNKRKRDRPPISLKTGCCLTFRLNAIETGGRCEPTVHARDHLELILHDPWARQYAFTAPGLLEKHYDNVARELSQLPPAAVEISRAVCARYVREEFAVTDHVAAGLSEAWPLWVSEQLETFRKGGFATV